MSRITADTSLQEIAVLVSEALSDADIPAILGGGAAVTQYSNNEYMSKDLDFITVERNKVIAPVVAELGFHPRGKDFVHAESEYFIEFPPGPLSFGDRYIDSSETTILDTKYGKLRIITPTQCVMDRLSWLIHHNDKQARDQAVMVAAHQEIDWVDVRSWAEGEGADAALVDEIRHAAEDKKAIT
jgi:hypothetical protein